LGKPNAWEAEERRFCASYCTLTTGNDFRLFGTSDCTAIVYFVHILYIYILYMYILYISRIFSSFSLCCNASAVVICEIKNYLLTYLLTFVNSDDETDGISAALTDARYVKCTCTL